MGIGSRMKFQELKVDPETVEIIKAVAGELELPVGNVISIALEWFADVMCTPDGPLQFTKWLEDNAKEHGRQEMGSFS